MTKLAAPFSTNYAESSKATHRPLFITFAVLVLASWSWLLAWRSYEHLADDFRHLGSHCAHVRPISQTEYASRQNNLADVLGSLGANAYLAEPGANTQFFANFSQASWRLSERPFLLVISPEATSGDEVEAVVTVLTPKFEATRAKLLSIPYVDNYVEWPEETDPYATLLSAMSLAKHVNATIYVDNSIRKFIVDGLQRANPTANILSAPLEITHLRERKSAAELEILKCAQEVTLLAIRAVHKKMYIGISESRARQMMSAALTSAGLKNGGCLTLFGANAALPHGSGSDRILGKDEFALFDCTATLHGYNSDVTRTVALSDSEIPKAHCHIWDRVKAAQDAALAAANNGTLTKDVDHAARQVLEAAGYGSYFTHRLGHGIGLEGHEQPYLRGGSEDVLRIGHTFSDEPGVYIDGEVGIRLEDCFYVAENGSGTFLTNGVGGPSASPWKP